MSFISILEWLLKFLVFALEITVAVELVYVWLRRIKAVFKDHRYDIRPIQNKPSLRLGIDRTLHIRDIWRFLASVISLTALLVYGIGVYWYGIIMEIIVLPFVFLPIGIVLLVLMGILKILMRLRLRFLWYAWQGLKSFFTFLFTWMVYVPSLILNKTLVERAQPGLWNKVGYLLTYLLPNQLFSDLFRGYLEEFSEVRIIFLVVILGTLVTLYHVIASLLGKKDEFTTMMLKEWDPTLEFWVDPHPLNDNNEAWLLLHGFAADITSWTTVNKKHGDQLSFVTEAAKLGKRVFALNFSNHLFTGLRFDYVISRKKTYSPFTRSLPVRKLNNYAWELLFTLYVMKYELGIQKVRIITHSTGGIVARLALVGHNRLLEELLIDDLVEEVIWLAAPHRGAHGGSDLIFGVASKLRPSNWLLLVIKLVAMLRIEIVEEALDAFSTRLISMSMDAQTALDLRPGSDFLNRLNLFSKDVVVINPAIRWRNAYGSLDKIVGEGAILLQRDFNYYKKHGLGEVEQQEFEADHAGAFHEELNALTLKAPSIHRSKEVFDWIFK